MHNASAEGAKYKVWSKNKGVCVVQHQFRAFRAKTLDWFFLGRWPRLFHFAPLALRPELQLPELLIDQLIASWKSLCELGVMSYKN